MLLLDDGTEPIPECHSGTAFPWNRHGALASTECSIPAGQAAQLHLVTHCDLSKVLLRATILLRGRQAPEQSDEAQADKSIGGLIMGSASLRFVPQSYSTSLAGNGR